MYQTLHQGTSLVLDHHGGLSCLALRRTGPVFSLNQTSWRIVSKGAGKPSQGNLCPPQAWHVPVFGARQKFHRLLYLPFQHKPQGKPVLPWDVPCEQLHSLQGVTLLGRGELLSLFLISTPQSNPLFSHPDYNKASKGIFPTFTPK